MECKVPRCYKSKKNNCSLPNPWIIFNKTHKGFTDKTTKDMAYLEFKNKMTPKKKVDENAYRASLCLYKEKQPITTKSTIVSRFVAKLMKERQEIEMECKMTPNLVDFFEKFVPSSIVGSTTLNPCQVIAKYMLAQCVPKDQLKYYTFQDSISHGAHGLLISGTYKKKPIAIKIIPVHKQKPHKLSFTINGKQQTLKSVSEKNILREFNIQKAVGDINFKEFDVPSVYGNMSIMKSKKNSDRIAVLIMDKIVDIIDIEKMSFDDQCKYAAKIPCMLHKLHEHGFIHGDLHMWNIMTTAKKSYVIDFGRSIDTNHTTIQDKQDIQMLEIMDYIIPLEMILRGVNYYNYNNLGKMMIMYLDAMDHCPAGKKLISYSHRSRTGFLLLMPKRFLSH